MTHVPKKALRAAVLGPMLVAISSCGGGGGDGGASCSPPPAISSNPPTAATVGQQYAYWVDASYVCIPFFTPCGGIDGVQLPPGAGIDDFRDLVYWTPAPGHAGTSVPFTIATEPDLCGDRATQSWSVQVLAAPSIQSFSASAQFVSPGQSVTLLPRFEGSGTIDGIGPVTSGVAIMTAPLHASATFTLTVVNAGSGEARQSVQVRVLGEPAVGSLSASPAIVSAGDTTRLRWVTSGDYSVARLEPGDIDVMGRPSIDIAPAASTTYTLTIANELGQSASASVAVQVVPRSIILDFTASPSSGLLGEQVSLRAQYEGGSGELRIVDGVTYTALGPIASGETVVTQRLLRTTNFQLVVENATGQRATREIVVLIQGPGTFQPSPGQPVFPGRTHHTATRLSDGRVFVAGDYGIDRRTEIFEPSTESFVEGPDLLEPRRDHAAALLADGRVLLIAGSRAELTAGGLVSTALRNAEIFDPVSGRMTAGGVFPGGFSLARPRAAALADGRVLVVTGGRIPGAFIYDPATSTFGVVNFEMAGHLCLDVEALDDGNALVIESIGEVASEIFVSAANGFFTTGPARPDRGCSAFGTARLQDGRVLLVGGNAPGVPAEVYEPGTRAFAPVGQQYYPSHRPRAITLPSGLVLVKANGYGAELFDPVTGTFSQTGGTLRGRFLPSATLLQDGRVLVVGGCSMSPCEAELYSPQ